MVMDVDLSGCEYICQASSERESLDWNVDECFIKCDDLDIYRLWNASSE